VVRQDLKIHISTTFVVLLVLGMIMINVVVTFFWQRSLIEEKKTGIVGGINLYQQACYEGGGALCNLNLLKRSIGKECKEAFVYDGKTAITADLPDLEDIPDLFEKSYNENRAIEHFAGLAWRNFSMGSKYLVSIHPFESTEGKKISLGVVVDLDQLYSRVREKQPVIFVYILLNSLILGTVGFFRMALRILRPIDKLITISESYSNVNELIFSSNRQGGEFGKLSFALNSMLNKIHDDKKELKKTIQSLEAANMQLRESEGKVVRAEKLAAVGRLSAGLAHEIGNPVGIVQGYLELLKQHDLSAEEREEFTQRGVRELERINTMIRQLLDFSRTSPKAGSLCSVSTVCNDALQAILLQKHVVKVEFSTDFYGGPDEVCLAADDLYQVLINCLYNALDAIKEKEDKDNSKISITTEHINDDEKGQRVKIILKDNGVGVPESIISSVFDPFFTTKDVGKGTGLGLSVSIAIIEAAGGAMEIESVGEFGTEVVIDLPLVR
jgi:two-component system, NtrC family, sensor kinase